MTEEIVQALSKCFSAKFKVKVEEKKQKEKMNKAVFKKILLSLKEAVEKSSEAKEMIGIDLSGFEEPFVKAIEELLHLSFTDDQIFIINLYLYEEYEFEDDWDGKIKVVTKGGTSQSYDFKTPEDVWNVVQIVGNVEEK